MRGQTLSITMYVLYVGAAYVLLHGWSHQPKVWVLRSNISGRCHVDVLEESPIPRETITEVYEVLSPPSVRGSLRTIRVRSCSRSKEGRKGTIGEVIVETRTRAANEAVTDRI